MALPPCWNSWKSTSWLKNIFKNCKIAATEYPNTEENIGIYFCWISHYQAQLQEIWQHWCFCLHVPWLRWLVNVLSPRQPEFSPGSVRAGLMVNKVALAQVFLRVRWFPCTYHSTVPLHTHISSGGWTNSRHVCSRSSETQSHPIDINNMVCVWLGGLS
jgi:hypothetical protein